MATAQNRNTLASISQEAVDFLKAAVREYCEPRSISVLPALSSAPPANQLHGMKLLKERCNLEYPLLEKTEHFTTGVELSVLEYPDGRIHLQFFSIDGHDPEIVGGGEGLVDLWRIEEEIRREPQYVRFLVATAIRISMAYDDLKLNRFKRRT